MGDDLEDGWNEDLDDLIIDDDDLGGQPAPVPAPAPTPIATPMAAPVPAHIPLPASNEGWNNDGDAWDDGLDDLDDLDTEAVAEHPEATNDGTNRADDEQGWGDDFMDFDDTNAAATPPRQANHRLDEIHKELVSYVESLMVLLPSINAVLEAEYNLPEKAADLLHYYHERPQLREYTIEKELSRMEYQVHLQHENGEEPIVVDNKQEIANLFKLQEELDMLTRCANQSLLADLLHVMTGPDGLVRPQYMATCLAESCRFVLRCKAGQTGGLVECTSQLVLSLPEPSGSRYPVANIKALTLLGVPSHPNQPPMVKFKLLTMDIVIPSMDVLKPTAQFLLESGLMDEPCMSPFPESSVGPGPIDDNDTFRDVFLQQSQSMLQHSTVGLSNAWKQIDSVAGLQNKMKMVKNVLPMADSSMIEAAMQEQEAYQQQLQAHQQPPLPREHVPVVRPLGSGGPPPPPPSQPQARPTSILSSFMGRIAKSVALPEEDPSFYENYAMELQKSNSAGGQPQTSFPRPPPAPAPASDEPLKLGRTSDHNNKPQSPAPAPATSPPGNASRWLSRMAAPTVAAPTPPPPAATLHANQGKKSPAVAERDEDDNFGLDDGWGDDLDVDVDVDADPEDKVGEIDVPTVAKGTPPAEPTATTPSAVASSPPKEPEAKFSPQDDVVETRKRWVNPRPGPRYLTALLS